MARAGGNPFLSHTRCSFLIVQTVNIPPASPATMIPSVCMLTTRIKLQKVDITKFITSNNVSIVESYGDTQKITVPY